MTDDEENPKSEGRNPKEIRNPNAKKGAIDSLPTMASRLLDFVIRHLLLVIRH